MQLAKRVNGTDEVSHSDLQKLLKQADKNNDGLVELFEFKEAFITSDKYKDLEEEYLAAFEEISKFDGDSASISESDINVAISEYDKIASVAENINVNSSLSSGNSSSNVNSSINVNGSGSASGNRSRSGNNNKVNSLNLSNKELSELKSERSDVLSEISSARSEKSQAISQANSDVSTAQKGYSDATKEFAEIVQEKIEAEETTNEYAKNVVDYENQKNALDSDITNQKGAISEAENTVSTISSELSSLVEPPETISYFDEKTQKTVSEHNPEHDNYIAQKEALEAELAAAEEDLANKEGELEFLESELEYTEGVLDQAIILYARAEEEQGRLTEEESNAFKNIAVKNEAYVTAKQAKDEISTEYDEHMDTLQDNLTMYNDAISEKELKLPDDYGVKNGIITNGKHNLVGTDKDNLPKGYEFDGTSIKDKDGNIVGVTVENEDSQQLYLFEKVEPESVGAATCYEYARMFFEDAIGNAKGQTVDIWTNKDLTDVNSKDIKQIAKYYNSIVVEYNAKLKDGETPALTYTEEAENRSSSDEGSKANYDAIVSAISKTDSEVTIRQNSFETYLNNKNIDISNTSEKQMSEILEEFMEQKYGKLYNEKYYPPVTEEKLAEYIGEGSLETLKEADDITVNTTINKILTDNTLTPYQQMQLLNSIKSYDEDIASNVNNYFQNDDSYFYQTLEEMSSVKNDDGSFEYSSKDLIEFIKQYKNIDSTSSIFAATDDPNNDTYMQVILSVYERTDDNYELKQLDRYINPSIVADYVLQNNNIENPQEYLAKLLKSSVSTNLDEDGNLSVNPQDYGLNDTEEVENLEITYLNSNETTSEKIEKVFEDLNGGSIDRSTAQYLVSSILNGKPENIANVKTNSQIVTDTIELLGEKPYQAFSSDYKMVTEYVDGHGDTPPYLLIKPENVAPDEELPVIVYLHGSGQLNRGKAGLENYNQPGAIIPNWELEGFNGYVICPTLSGKYADKSDSRWTTATAQKYVRNLLDDFESEHNVDTNKVFIGGHSLGANGAIYMAEKMDDIFSKAFILSGYEHDNLYNIQNVKIPIIGYNGKSDSPYMNKEFQDTVGEENVINVNARHGAVSVDAFNRDADNDGKSDLFEWLLEGQALPQ